MLQSIDLRGHVTTRKPEAQRRIQEGSYQSVWARESVLFIGTQFSILYTFVYSPA